MTLVRSFGHSRTSASRFAVLPIVVWFSLAEGVSTDAPPPLVGNRLWCVKPACPVVMLAFAESRCAPV
jgi:hypothetical protein